MRYLQTFLLTLTCLLPACATHEDLAEPSPQDLGGGEVLVNGARLNEEQLAGLERLYGVRPRAGRWWYDPASGLYGGEGGPAAGLMFAGHDLGVPSPGASAGTSSVWVNGRQLTRLEVLHIVGMVGGPVLPGRYWLDARFDVGVEGSPFPLGNLVALARRAGGGGDNFWSTRFGAGNSTADNSHDWFL